MLVLLRCTILAGCAWLALGTGAKAGPTGLLYIDDVNGQLGTVNLATGAVNVIGDTGLGLTDIAFQNGKLYGTTFTGFYALNATTGAPNFIAAYGNAGQGGINALAGSSGPNLYAVSSNTSRLYTVSPTGTVATVAGTTGTTAAGALAFAADGSLYESGIDAATGFDDLVKITLGGTVSGTKVADFTHNGTMLSRVFGLAEANDGTLYAVNGTTIYSVNLANANLTQVRNYAGNGLDEAFGAAFLPAALPVPEPTSLTLLGAALLGLGLARRQRG